MLLLNNMEHKEQSWWTQYRRAGLLCIILMLIQIANRGLSFSGEARWFSYFLVFGIIFGAYTMFNPNINDYVRQIFKKTTAR
jgi:hypothetical protein